ncbi:acyl carrier protein [Actinocrispum wychmicini]|uniref:Acyl carrier protein n=1 Tax=Actinocrispum wychmicini TaxID=1213861 RepID=A0A4R2ILH7_9PSEU|nr:phosphopantetheine-binding protein [Actinocrispum wychmicini]TCO44778.1 acyl carrier protein [Actinocrispum wychmicini]
MTSRSAVVAAIESALRDVLAGDLPELGEDTRLFDDLGLESASVLELLMIVEEATGITVDAEELDIDDLRSVRSFADFVESRQPAGTDTVR